MLFGVLAVAACAQCLIMFLFYKKLTQPKPVQEFRNVDEEVRAAPWLCVRRRDVVSPVSQSCSSTLALFPAAQSLFEIVTCFWLYAIISMSSLPYSTGTDPTKVQRWPSRGAAAHPSVTHVYSLSAELVLEGSRAVVVMFHACSRFMSVIGIARQVFASLC